MTLEETPLTCEYCDSSPAVQVLIVDYRHVGRHMSLTCAPCGDVAEPEARRFGTVWRYALLSLAVADTAPQPAEAAS